jgi:hypothetical protein
VGAAAKVAQKAAPGKAAPFAAEAAAAQAIAAEARAAPPVPIKIKRSPNAAVKLAPKSD